MSHVPTDLPLATIVHADGVTTRVSTWEANLAGATLTCPGWNCTHCLDSTS